MTSRFPRLALPALAALLFGLAACDSVTVEPRSSAAASRFFTEEGAYTSFLAKLYGSLIVTGQSGPAGAGDLTSLDEGFSQYTRLLWQLQELSTDAAVVAWNDNGIRNLHEHSWSPSNQFVSAMYYRIYFLVAQSNEFLRQSTPERLEEYGVLAEERALIPRYRAEARFLRALAYWHAIDLFGDVPLVTEEFGISSEAPPQNTREEVFNFIESELLAVTGDGSETVAPIGAGEYGRADAGAALTLLAKLYQNAVVYTGADRSADVVRVTEEIIDSGAYRLEDDYHDLFLADNHTADGIIFALPQDGTRTQSFGGTTFLVHAPYGGGMDPATFGIDFGWGGLRTTSTYVDLFEGDDQRPVFPRVQPAGAQFYQEGQSKVINDIGTFTDGYAVPKFQNVTSDGVPGQNLTFPDTDFPMFRIADVYLMYAEAVLRGGGGDRGRALGLVNEVRERAFEGDDDAEIDDGELTLDFLLTERARELMWEGHRRTDLVRFDRFAGGAYVWAWKGGVPDGQATDEYRDLYPLPASELRANPNLSQNPGY
jgi:hypothetical protein